MADEFTRIYVHDADYTTLRERFSEGESRPAQGVLVRRALECIEKLEKEVKMLREEP